MSETQQLLEEALRQKRKLLTVQESKKILLQEGFPINPTAFGTNLEELLTKAEKIGFPIALKVSSHDIVHKSDVGGVITGIRDIHDLKEQYEIMQQTITLKAPTAHIEGFIIEKMESGVELLIGSTHDPMFGPILAFGLGGIYVEVLKDVVFRLIPIEKEDATEMLSEIKAAKILDGIRGQPPVDKKALVDLMMRTSDFIHRHSTEIEELDLNPVFATETGVSVVDARIILKVPE
ncbi:MAG: acetate--CoA ligase family protein [Candidatus Heimdallarchaeota archaeon]|nr:MAG: acetate--CoA ligase family protein [Candidatus Heimdallarchaeota archaeon]